MSCDLTAQFQNKNLKGQCDRFFVIQLHVGTNKVVGHAVFF